MNFVKDVAERALGAAAAVVLASLGGDQLSLYDINPGTALGQAGAAALVVVLGSLVTRYGGSSRDNASLL